MCLPRQEPENELEVYLTAKSIRTWELDGLTDDDGRLLKVILSPKIQGKGNFSLSVVVAPPGSLGPMHLHKCSDEFWYILDGRGVITVGEEKIHVEPDVVVYGPANVPHQLENTGKDPLRAIFIFSPPGPEEPLMSKSATER